MTAERWMIIWQAIVDEVMRMMLQVEDSIIDYRRRKITKDKVIPWRRQRDGWEKGGKWEGGKGGGKLHRVFIILPQRINTSYSY